MREIQVPPAMTDIEAADYRAAVYQRQYEEMSGALSKMGMDNLRLRREIRALRAELAERAQTA